MRLVDQPQFDGTPALHVHKTSLPSLLIRVHLGTRTTRHICAFLPCRPVNGSCILAAASRGPDVVPRASSIGAGQIFYWSPWQFQLNILAPSKCLVEILSLSQGADTTGIQ